MSETNEGSHCEECKCTVSELSTYRVLGNFQRTLDMWLCDHCVECIRHHTPGMLVENLKVSEPSFNDFLGMPFDSKLLDQVHNWVTFDSLDAMIESICEEGEKPKSPLIGDVMGMWEQLTYEEKIMYRYDGTSSEKELAEDTMNDLEDLDDDDLMNEVKYLQSVIDSRKGK